MKSLFTLLFALFSIAAFAQPDIRTVENQSQVRRPAEEFARPFVLKKTKEFKILFDEGTVITIPTRLPKITKNVWPPELITDPIVGDKIEGPVIANTPYRWWAEYNGTGWDYYVKTATNPFP